jgi:hypothetical protein
MAASQTPPPTGPVGQPMTVTGGTPPPAPPRRKRRGRRAGAGAGGVLVALLIAGVVLVKTGHNPLPADVPLVGRTADDVYRDIKDAGYRVTDGHPTGQFRNVAENNSCKSSRTFVRTDADVGWAVICVKPPRSAYRRLSAAFENVPSLIGPLYLDDSNGELVIFGFGWPEKASKQIYDAVGADGSYLGPK